jgi:hypothetical protein
LEIRTSTLLQRQATGAAHFKHDQRLPARTVTRPTKSHVHRGEFGRDQIIGWVLELVRMTGLERTIFFTTILFCRVPRRNWRFRPRATHADRDSPLPETSERTILAA